MSVWVAFLRGVNLGKRTVRSAELVEAFTGLGFTGVRTLIASGNVLFEADGEVRRGAIEKGLEEKFGFAIGVVLRSHAELRAMVAEEPFAAVDPRADVALHVMLLAEPAKPVLELEGVAGDYDVARVEPAEIYLVAHKKPDGTYIGRSAIGELDKSLSKGHLVTMRNWNTIVKAAK